MAKFTVHVLNNLLIYVIGILGVVSNTLSLLWRSLTGTLLGIGISAYLIYKYLGRKQYSTKIIECFNIHILKVIIFGFNVVF